MNETKNIAFSFKKKNILFNCKGPSVHALNVICMSPSMCGLLRMFLCYVRLAWDSVCYMLPFPVLKIQVRLGLL